jgi:chemotaxis-related protein WspD
MSDQPNGQPDEQICAQTGIPIPVRPSGKSLFERPFPPGYRDELRELEAEFQFFERHDTGSMLLFHLGDIRLALPTRVASAVAPVLHIARIPHRSGTVLLGLAAFRGEILPCCSLARILDLPSSDGQSEAATARTLILEETTTRRWAVPIDGVLGVRTGAREICLKEVPVAAQWLQNSFIDDDGEFHLLDPDILFRQITLATA